MASPKHGIRWKRWRCRCPVCRASGWTDIAPELEIACPRCTSLLIDWASLVAAVAKRESQLTASPTTPRQRASNDKRG